METTEMMEVDENSGGVMDSDSQHSGKVSIRSGENKSDESSYVVMWSCPHLTELKSEDMLASYELLHAFYISCIAEGSSQKLKRANCVCKMKSCKRKQEKIHACLSCIYFGCYERHIKTHAIAKKHYLAVDMEFGHVYCSACGDYQHDADFYNIAQKNNSIAANQRNQRSIPYKWEPTPEEIFLLENHEVTYNYKMGARGIVNDQIICFLVVLVQSLVHAPAFRDYLLSFEHQCKFPKTEEESLEPKCKLRKTEEVSSEPPKKTEEVAIRVPVCFVCEMTLIVQEYFSEEKGPLALGGLLYLLMNVEHLRIAINEGENDCTDFFQPLLEKLHEHSYTATTFGAWHCNCVIHTMFGIPFYRKKTCNTCKNVSDEKFHTWCLTLAKQDLVPDGFVTMVPLKKSLKSFYYGEMDDYICSVCNAPKPALITDEPPVVRPKIKSVLIIEELPEVLPTILSFASNNDFREKSNYFIQFEEFLDMSDFVLPSESDPDPNEYKYYLFAVIQYIRADSNDSSNSESGHYLTYVRLHSDLWYKCNDDVTMETDIQEVLSAEARMLFYQKMYP